MRRRMREPDGAEQAVEQEIAHHMAEMADRLAAEGWTRADAEREAARRFGDVHTHRRAMLREQVARGRRSRIVEATGGLMTDLRQALRGLSRQPTFAAAVIATLGIALAAAATVFTVLDPLLLRPLPYHDPERLVRLSQLHPDGDPSVYVPIARTEQWRGATDVLPGTAMWHQAGAVYASGGAPIGLYGLVVSHDLDDVIGIRAGLGRTFTAGDALPGVRRVMLGHGFWQRMGAPRSVVGSTMDLDGAAYEVVGVLPPDFKFPVTGSQPDIWVALGTDNTALGHTVERMEVVARVADGVSIDLAQQRLDVMAAELDRTQPIEDGTWRVSMRPVDEWRGGRELGRAMWMLAIAVSLMMAIALTNGVNLLVLRGADRAREIEVRRALGGSRTRIVRQVVCEGVLLGIGSGVVALALTLLAASRMDTLLPSEFALFSVFAFRVEHRTLLFTFATALGAGAILGLIPGMRAVRGVGAFGLLKGRGGTDRDRRMTLALAGVEVALAMMLLAGAGLIAGSFVRLTRVDPGFEAENLAILSVGLGSARYPTPEARSAFFDHLEGALERIDGVQQASVGDGVPPGTSISFGVTLQAEGKEPLRTSADMILPHMSVRPDYIETIGGRIVAGRGLIPADAGTERALIDDNLARALWPDGGAVGRQFRWREDGSWHTVVGVYEHMTPMGPDDRATPFSMIFPLPHVLDRGGYTFAIRTRGDPEPLLPAMRAAVRELDPQLPVGSVTTARAEMAETIDRPRLLAAVMVTLSAVALFLAAIGIYGVLAYAAARRRREMGIRMALGAAPQSVRALIVRQGLLTSIAGVCVGLVVAALLSRTAGSLLFGVEPGDPATFAGAALVLLMVAVLASWLPARRATRVDPVEVLRAD